MSAIEWLLYITGWACGALVTWALCRGGVIR